MSVRNALSQAEDRESETSASGAGPGYWL